MNEKISKSKKWNFIEKQEKTIHKLYDIWFNGFFDDWMSLISL